ARTAQAQAQSQALRNTLLAAIAHDHRTPLATILGAAGSLHDQAERLSPPQRLRLAATIVDEATQLSRLTENSLQLARLDAVGLDIRRDWESVEEIVGTVLRRVRQRHPGQGIRTRVEAGLPLLRCDAVLMVQLLDNLVDNALKYGGDPAAVQVVACLQDGRVVIAVCDRGPGVPAEQRERIFETFQRGDSGSAARRPDSPVRRGAGIGLALCKAIARAHRGELRLRQRHRGGSCFELVLPVEPAPEVMALPDVDPSSA
ncbi:MAG: two-component sensor histidine kinase, partial [Rubrivivax sp.]|nr:two-component sensor histidine kinase [Rubrivivax sp.]